MNKLIKCGWFILIVVFLCGHATAELTKDDIIGDPKVSLEPILPDLQWLTGTTLGLFIIIGVASILVGGIIYFGGSAVGSSGAKSKGISGVIGCVGVGLVVVMAITMFLSIAL